MVWLAFVMGWFVVLERLPPAASGAGAPWGSGLAGETEGRAPGESPPRVSESLPCFKRLTGGTGTKAAICASVTPAVAAAPKLSRPPAPGSDGLPAAPWDTSLCCGLVLSRNV